MRSPTPNVKPVHLSHLHLLALHERGALHRTRLSQSPYGQWLYMEATIHQVCLIFLSLDGAHLRQRVYTMTFFIPPIKTIRGYNLVSPYPKVRATQEALP